MTSFVPKLYPHICLPFLLSPRNGFIGVLCSSSSRRHLCGITCLLATLSFATLHWPFGLLPLPRSLSPEVDDISGIQKQKSVLPHKGHAGQMRTQKRTVCLVSAKEEKDFS